MRPLIAQNLKFDMQEHLISAAYTQQHFEPLEIDNSGGKGKRGFSSCILRFSTSRFRLGNFLSCRRAAGIKDSKAPLAREIEKLMRARKLSGWGDINF
jgi:hypothetical protein